MASTSAGQGSGAAGSAYARFFDRIDRALTPILGAGPSVDGDDTQPPVGERACPLCGHRMQEHRHSDSGGNVIVICPGPELLPEPASTGPLNELGMPINGRRLERNAPES